MKITAKKPLRILCAEDNRLLSEVLVRLFTLAGHKVDHVADGLDAWEKLSKDIDQFDVLITDHEMPGLAGLELVELLRQTDFKGRIIVHTSALTPKQTEKYHALKVDRVVVKTTPAEELLEIVEAFHETGPSRD